MPPTLVSVHIAVPRFFRVRGREIPTGIYKEPVRGRVALHRLGLAGDVQADRRFHGGPDKAVYVYPLEHYEHWKNELGRDLTAGFFGENFTVAGLDEAAVKIGDVFRVGSAAVQVTSPRTPCFKLGLKVGSPGFLRRFLESGRLGYYLRVIEEGDVGAGDGIERTATNPRQPTLAEHIDATYHLQRDAAGLATKA